MPWNFHQYPTIEYLSYILAHLLIKDDEKDPRRYHWLEQECQWHWECLQRWCCWRLWSKVINLVFIKIFEIWHGPIRSNLFPIIFPKGQRTNWKSSMLQPEPGSNKQVLQTSVFPTPLFFFDLLPLGRLVQWAWKAVWGRANPLWKLNTCHLPRSFARPIVPKAVTEKKRPTKRESARAKAKAAGKAKSKAKAKAKPDKPE